MQPTYIIKVGLQDSKRLKQLNTRTIVCYKCTLAHTSCIVKAASDFAAAPRGRKLLSITCMAFSIASSLIPSDSLISIPPCSKILGTYFVQCHHHTSNRIQLPPMKVYMCIHKMPTTMITM